MDGPPVPGAGHQVRRRGGGWEAGCGALHGPCTGPSRPCHLATLRPPSSPPALIRLPCITVAYTDLAIETDAAVGAAGIPTVASWLGIDALRACGRRLACKGSGPTTCRLPILRGVQGVLRPVSAAAALG